MRHKFLKPRLSLVFASLFFLSCADNDTFTGYLVAKEYTPEHMSNESENTVSYAALSIIVPPHTVVVHRPQNHMVEAKWVWFIANKHQVICKEVSKKVFDTQKCGTRITIKR